MNTELEIYGINNVTAENFVDRVISENPPQKVGVFEMSIQTNEPIKFKNEPEYQVRDIQKIFFPKYKIEFLTTPDYDLELLKYSRKVLIIQDGESNQEAVILDVNRSIVNVNLAKIEVEYYDRAVNSYTGTVVEYLKSEWLKSTVQEIETFDLFYDSTNYISTRIEPIEMYTNPETETIKLNKANHQVKSTLKQSKKLVFYLSQEELITFSINAHRSLLTLTGTVTAKEVSYPKIAYMSGWDLFKVEYDYIYNINEYTA